MRRATTILLVLSAFFSLLVFEVSKLPVPEHLQLKQIILVLLGVAALVSWRPVRMRPLEVLRYE